MNNIISKNCIISLSVLTILLLFNSCQVDHTSTTYINIENGCSHDILIKIDPAYSYGHNIPTEINIDKGKSFEFMIIEERDDLTPIDGIMPYECIVSFDGNVVTRHREKDGNSYNNFCNSSSYKEVSKKKRTQKYSFKFTDKDYEYAVNNPY